MTAEFISAQVSEDFVHVQGHPRPLRTVVFDEVYRIGREAYINAVAHSSARRIEMSMEYGPRVFRLIVRDDGCGIDPEVLQHGSEGHWGLAGMRERAEGIGATLAIRTRTPGGTEIELRVPASIAYLPTNPRRMPWPWRSRKHYPEQKEKS
jgi:signal transduction histidine kinase